MRITFVFLMQSFLVLGIATNASAATILWTGGGGTDTLWSNPSNWDAGVPTAADFARNPLGGGSAMLIDGTVAAVAGDLDFGVEAGPTTLNMTGGNLDVVQTDGGSGNLKIAFGGGTLDPNGSVMNLSGGAVTATILTAGNFGDGTLNMTGGTVDLSFALVVAENIAAAGGSGKVQLDGGTITMNILILKNGGLIDITDGTLQFNGVAASAAGNITDLISGGFVTGFGGAGTVVVDTTTTPGSTIVTAVIPEPGSMMLLSLGLVGLLLCRTRVR
ncbi:MAG: PEP-CTERM sorting domain-containing protein [Planctomycetes bacterium]|nr:PEP-CTERM sorting domain-containing protein [Planctomycetota bacterium]